MDLRGAGLKAVAEMLGPEIAEDMDKKGKTPAFGSHLSEIALTSIFGGLWARPGLDRRARSLVTLGILIALRASDELAVHFKIARKNGCTMEEIEEVIYHASGYAGAPAANHARAIAARALAEG